MTTFFKYQAAGNDFVIIDTSEACTRDGACACVSYWQRRAKNLCDRHFGIGADGLLLVSGHQTESSDARMDIINADGSLAAMCGNGIRCAARFLADKARLSDASWRIDTLGGIQAVSLRHDAGPFPIEVAMARVTLGNRCQYRAEDGRVFEGRKVDVGNPHFVIVCDPSECHGDVDHALHLLAERYGEALSHAPLFEDGANIEFVSMAADGTASMAVYERGCGITLACGTGATATGAVLMNDFGLKGTCIIQARGGKLCIKPPHADGRYRLCGDARRVFMGEVCD